MPKFQGHADKEEVFTLPSSILVVQWRETEGFINGTCTLDVRTAFVGDGSPIKVTLQGRDGSLFEKIEGKVYGDLFRKQIKLTEKAAGGLACEAELPEHKLKLPGLPLRVGGAIRLSNPKWTVKETGKPVTLLKRSMEVNVEVKAEGVSEGTEARIDFLQKLGEHRISKWVSIPTQVTAGKIVMTWIFDYRKATKALSSKKEKEMTAEEYKAPKIYFEAHCLGLILKGPEVDFLDWVRIELLGEDGLPMVQRKIRLVFPDGKSQNAETDETGNVLVEDVPPGQFTVEWVEE